MAASEKYTDVTSTPGYGYEQSQSPPPQYSPGQPAMGMQGQAPVTYTAPPTSNTVVVVNQPQARAVPQPRMWTSGLCACFDDLESCCCVTWCGCIYGCMMSADMGESCCLPVCTSCAPPWLLALRVKMRAENQIQGTIMDDAMVTCCCTPCAMCQLKREFNYVRMQQQAQMSQIA